MASVHSPATAPAQTEKLSALMHCRLPFFSAQFRVSMSVVALPTPRPMKQHHSPGKRCPHQGSPPALPESRWQRSLTQCSAKKVSCKWPRPCTFSRHCAHLAWDLVLSKYTCGVRCAAPVVLRSAPALTSSADPKHMRLYFQKSLRLFQLPVRELHSSTFTQLDQPQVESPTFELVSCQLPHSALLPEVSCFLNHWLEQLHIHCSSGGLDRMRRHLSGGANATLHPSCHLWFQQPVPHCFSLAEKTTSFAPMPSCDRCLATLASGNRENKSSDCATSASRWRADRSCALCCNTAFDVLDNTSNHCDTSLGKTVGFTLTTARVLRHGELSCERILESIIPNFSCQGSHVAVLL